MTKTIRNNSNARNRRHLVSAFILASTMLVVPLGANAGQCPAGKEGNISIKDPPSEPVGVVDDVLSQIDLAKQKVDVAGYNFRLRRLTIQPAGVVPFHTHDERPALIYIVSGEIVEHSTGCAVPIVHKAGEAAMESVGLSHWWENMGSEPVVLTSTDIVQDMMVDKMK